MYSYIFMLYFLFGLSHCFTITLASLDERSETSLLVDSSLCRHRFFFPLFFWGTSALLLRTTTSNFSQIIFFFAMMYFILHRFGESSFVPTEQTAPCVKAVFLVLTNYPLACWPISMRLLLL